MKFLKSIVLFSTMLVFLGCGPRVSTQKMTDKPMGVYDTFAYLPNTNAEIPGKSYGGENINELIVESVNNHLQQWYGLDRETPDLLVLVDTAKDVEVGVNTEPIAYASYPYVDPGLAVGPFYEPYYYMGYAGFGPIMGYDTDLYTYKEGSLIISLVDSDTKEVVWRGISKNSFYDLTNNDAIQDMVGNIFSEFPLEG